MCFGKCFLINDLTNVTSQNGHGSNLSLTCVIVEEFTLALVAIELWTLLLDGVGEGNPLVVDVILAPAIIPSSCPVLCPLVRSGSYPLTPLYVSWESVLEQLNCDDLDSSFEASVRFSILFTALLFLPFL